VRYQAGDALVFGPETRGLPAHVLETFGVEERLRIPMLPDRRSLNLSNAVAVAVYEAWRQLGFQGGTG
jgi:tRNA (cytidine/uridine-2'-O-)-methyltransferase